MGAVPDHPTRDSAARLRVAADRLVAEAARAAGREGALILLTADALVTLECRWVAEHAPEGLAKVE